MLAFAGLIMAVGSFVMALPHFMSPKYEFGDNVAKQCDIVGKDWDFFCENVLQKRLELLLCSYFIF